MTPDDVVRHTKDVVTEAGAAFGHDPLYRARGRQLGLSRWPFYFGGRAGVLGEVGPEVVAAACGFFAPDLVHDSWDAARAALPLAAIVRADVEECARWARTVYGGLPGLERLAGLAEMVVAAAEPAGLPLFAAWRAHVVQDGDPAARAGLALLRLREHRGGCHLTAVLAHGLTPLTTILAGPGVGKAEANGWRLPWPALPPGSAAALVGARRLTDQLAAAPYAALTPAERADLVDLLGQVGEAHRRHRQSLAAGTDLK
ncbi:SCO6745 family protein [Nonomuraea zeae]|uniref:EvbL n=1 Tax=Nonomuraea zeae TaxID=1642303 RepID=A0A5S4H071_9ACTN|nr:hypothetical protein [Nonomuraea zeae]TMR38567.1 hypothetical protein ETD85_04355 [Nonomuraea zeae]